MSAWRAARLQVYGALLLAFVVALVVASIADYEHVFTRSVDVKVRADRTGLLVYPGSDVTLRGVLVGKVRSIHATTDGAVLDVALEPGKTTLIPRDVTADVQAPTVFGAKFVDLELPRGTTVPTGTGVLPAAERIRSGDVIMPTTVAVEINDVFQNLLGVLQHVDPAKVDTILGTVSGALKGQGQQLGETIVDTNSLTSQLDQHLDALRADLVTADPVLGGYANVAPALVTVLHNVGITAVTLAQTQQQFQSSLTGVTSLVQTAQQVLDQDQDGLLQLTATLAPTAKVLDYYTPTLPCIVNGTVQLGRALDPLLGGDYPGLHVMAGFLPGGDGYDPTKDLPIVDSTDGPDCLGGPIGSTVVAGNRLPVTTSGTALTPYPHISFRDGTTTAFGIKSDCLAAPGTGGACLSSAPSTSTSARSGASGLGLLDQLMGSGVIGR